jgi:starvation-inducible DNA-binding protein
MIRQLRKDLESREQFGDTGTADFLTAVMEKHEKMAWMLRSFYRITNH